MKGYVIGSIISLIIYIVINLINSEVYESVMPLFAITFLLVFHVIFFKGLVIDKKRLTYFGFLVVAAVMFYISIPELTQKQAAQKVLSEYDIEIIEVTHVPTNNTNPLQSSRAYFYRGYVDGEELLIRVNPNTGEVFEVEEQ